MIRKLVVTDDGSHTLKVEGLQEHYHSTFGAINESMHVFIKAGLNRVLQDKPDELSILEVGFGTGLNALLTLLEQKTQGVAMYYSAVEAYPLEEAIWTRLNYADIIGGEDARTAFTKLHRCSWNDTTEIVPGFYLEKQDCKLDAFAADKSFDLVYFDAFGPDVQPELWSEAIFRNIAGMTSPGGMLVTYSCKGSVKRALKAAGFQIEKLPGPKGKREILRGVKC